MSDMVLESFQKLREQLKNLKYGSATLTIHVRGGNIAWVEVQRAESLNAKDSKGKDE